MNLAGIDALTRLYLNSGVHGLTVLGIMGETHKLSDNKRRAVMHRYISTTNGRVPIIVDCSAARVPIERAHEAESTGAAIVMVAPPNNVRNLDLVFKHYRRLAEAIPVLVVVQDESVNTGA